MNIFEKFWYYLNTSKDMRDRDRLKAIQIEQYGLNPDGKPYSYSVPNIRWYKGNKIRRDRVDTKDYRTGSNDLGFGWFVCKYCGTEFQTCPQCIPHYGNENHSVCPDCEPTPQHSPNCGPMLKQLSQDPKSISAGTVEVMASDSGLTTIPASV